MKKISCMAFLLGFALVVLNAVYAKDIYIIHGYKSDNKYGWLPSVAERLRKEGHKVTILNLPNADKPLLKEWLEAMQEAIPHINEDSYFITHSLGGVAVLHFLGLQDFKSSTTNTQTPQTKPKDKSTHITTPQNATSHNAIPNSITSQNPTPPTYQTLKTTQTSNPTPQTSPQNQSQTPHKPKKCHIGGVILVAPFDEALEILPIFGSFTDTKPNYQALRENLCYKAVISAQDDRVVPTLLSQRVANSLNAEFVQTKSGGHFMESEGFRDLPLVVEMFKKVTK